MKENVNNVKQVFINQNRFIVRLLIRVKLHVLKNVVEQMFIHLNVIFCEFDYERFIKNFTIAFGIRIYKERLDDNKKRL